MRMLPPAGRYYEPLLLLLLLLTITWTNELQYFVAILRQSFGGTRLSNSGLIVLSLSVVIVNC